MATVRGTFEMNERPATASLRSIRTEGRDTQLQLERTGRAMDGVATDRQIARLEAYEGRLRSLRDTAVSSLSTVRSEWDDTDRQVTVSGAVMRVQVDDMKRKLRELSRERATPTIDLDGVNSALARVELLDSRLRALDRRRSNPRVGIGLGGGFGGGARPPSVPAAAPAPSWGRTGPPRVLGFGPTQLAIGAGALLPAGISLGGSAVGLAGSAGSALLGAGALGVAGGGGLAAAIGSIGTVALPAISGLKGASQALASFRQEVAESGRDSTQARDAWRAYNVARKAAPAGTANLLRNYQGLTDDWTRQTRPAQGDLIRSLGVGVSTARALAPQASGIANRFFDTGLDQAQDWGKFLRGGSNRRFLNSAGGIATDNLPAASRSLQNVLQTAENVTVATRPFFRQAMDFMEDWTGGWAESTDDIQSTRKTVGGMVDDLEAWSRLGGSAFGLLKDIATAGAPSGTSLVGSLTQQLDQWDDWINRNPRQVRQFFSDTEDSTRKLARGLGDVASALFKIGRQLQPLLDEFTGLLDTASKLGLLNPGGLPLLVAGARGYRGLTRAGGSRGAAPAEGYGAGAPMILPGGGGGGGVRGTLSRGRSFGGRVGSAYRAGGARPVTRSPGALTIAGEADEGLIGVRDFSRAAGLRSAAGYAGGEALGTVGRGLGGFGKAYAPLAAASALLAAAAQQGGPIQRLQAAGSSATFGIIPAPPTADEQYKGNYSKAIRQSNSEVRRIRRGAGYSPAQQYGVGALLDQYDLGSEATKFRAPYNRRGVPQGQRLSEYADTLAGHASDLRQSGSTHDLGRAAGLDQSVKSIRSGLRQQGADAATDFWQAFRTRSKSEGGAKAFKETTDDVKKQIKTLGPDGGRIFAQNTLDWAKQAAKNNPKLQDQYEALTRRVERSFQDMGQSIAVVHGQIYTGSQRDWKNIRQVISTESWKAESEASGAFGSLEQQVFRQLRGFGFNNAQAKNLMNDLQAGGADKHNAMSDIQSGPTGAGQRRSTSDQNRANAIGVHARGGRIARPPGGTLTDVVPIGPNALAAGDELVVNRHSERRINQMLSEYGTTLGGEVGRESREHYKPVRETRVELGGRLARFARGGRGAGRARGRRRGGSLASGPVHLDGHPGGLEPGITKVLGAVESKWPGLTVTATSDGTHAANSYHYKHEAVDLAGDTTLMNQAAAWIRSSGLYRQLVEGIHNPNLSISGGHPVDPSFWGAETWAGHANHIHVAVDHAVGGLRGLSATAGSQLGSGPAPRVHLRAPGSKLRGVPGVLSNRGQQIVAAGMQGKVNRALARRRGGGAGARGGLAGGGPIPPGLQRYNRTYPDGGGPSLPPGTVAAIASWAGLPGTTFSQIAHGESNYMPGADGGKAGTPGPAGYGLWQITPDVQSSSTVARFNRIGSYFNPFANALMAKFLYSSAGNSISPWYGTRYVTQALGGRMPGRHAGRAAGWGGWHRTGGEFSTRPGQPILFGAGEGQQVEDVSIRPRRASRRAAGRRGGSGRAAPHVHFHDVHVRDDSDLDKIADKVGEKLRDAILRAPDDDDDEVL